MSGLVRLINPLDYTGFSQLRPGQWVTNYCPVNMLSHWTGHCWDKQDYQLSNWLCESALTSQPLVVNWPCYCPADTCPLFHLRGGSVPVEWLCPWVSQWACLYLSGCSCLGRMGNGLGREGLGQGYITVGSVRFPRLVRGTLTTWCPTPVSGYYCVAYSNSR